MDIDYKIKSICDEQNKKYCIFNMEDKNIENWELHYQYGENINILNQWIMNPLFVENINVILKQIIDSNIKTINTDFTFYNNGIKYDIERIGGGGGNQVYKIKENEIYIDYILKIGLDKREDYSDNISQKCLTESCNKDFINILINNYLVLIHNFCGNTKQGFGFIYEENGMIRRGDESIDNTPYSLFYSKKLNMGNRNDNRLNNGYYYEMHKLYYINNILSTTEIQNIMIQYLCHIRHLHQLGIIHRDIWHRNIFFRYHENPIDIILNFTLREGNENENESYNCIIKTQYEVFISDFDRSVFVNEVNYSSTSNYIDYFNDIQEDNQFFKNKWVEASIETELLFMYMILYLLKYEYIRPFYDNKTLIKNNTTLFWDNDIIRDDFDDWFLKYIMYDNLQFEERSEGVYLTNIINTVYTGEIRDHLYNPYHLFDFLYNINYKYSILYYNNMYYNNYQYIEYTKLPFRIENKEHLMLYRGFIHSFPFDKIKRENLFIYGEYGGNIYNKNENENVLSNYPFSDNIYQMFTSNEERFNSYDHPNVFDMCNVNFENKYYNCKLYTQKYNSPESLILNLIQNEQLILNKTYLFINGGFYNTINNNPILINALNTSGTQIQNYDIPEKYNENCMDILGLNKYKYISIKNNKIYFRENDNNYNDEYYTYIFPITKFIGKDEVSFYVDRNNIFLSLEDKINNLNNYIENKKLNTNNLCPDHLSNPNPRLILLLEYDGIYEDVSEREPDKINILNFGGRQILSEGIRIIDIVNFIKTNVNENKTYIMCNLDGGFSANIYYYIHMQNVYDEKMFVKENIDKGRNHTHYIMFEFDNERFYSMDMD
jgi:hypothetical protein